MNFYWEIIQFDGTVTEIPPEFVDIVRRKMERNEPISTTNMTIPANQIKTFRQTSKLFGQQNLLEGAAQAFNTPIMTEDKSMEMRFVKKPVTPAEWNKHYSGIPAYEKLPNENGMIMVGFWLPTHQIDLTKVTYADSTTINT